MKHRNIFLRMTAILLAVSLVFSNGTVLDVVHASYETPAAAGSTADFSDSTEDSDTADTSGGSESTEDPGTPDTPEDPEDPDTPDTPEDPEDPDTPDTPEDPEDPDTPDTPENPDDPAVPEIPEESDSVSGNSLDEEDEELEISLLADGEATNSGTCGNNLTWEYYADTKTLVISGSGEMNDYGSSPFKSLDFENLVIGEGVTSIGNNAFQGCTNLAGKVSLPVSLKKIGEYAFGKISSDLTEIEIHFADGEGGEGGRELTIGRFAFEDCTALESIHFPSDLTRLAVDTGAYRNCTSLKETNIPGGLGDGVITTAMGFGGMTSVKKITVEEEVTSIEGGSLPKDNLEEIWLPGTLTAISNNLFNGARKLQRINPTADCDVNIPERIETIGENAFQYCTSLAGKVSLPVSLKKIGRMAFSHGENITEIHFADGEGGRELTFGDYAFEYCTALESIHFPSDLTKLNVSIYTYSNCTSLKEITIPGSLGEITYDMYFHKMTSVEKITVEEGIGSIAKDSLPTGNLVEIQLPGKLTAISNDLFNGARKLQRINPTADCDVNIPKGIETIGNNAFNNCDSLAGTINLPVSLKAIGEQAFNDADKITELHFTDGEGGEGDRELTIGRNAFNSCDNLNSIHFPSDLTTLEAYSSAYYNCPSLEEINIPGSLGVITTDMGFQGMTSVEKITVEEGIGSIAKGSLPTGNLVEIRLPGTLTAIANELFWDASKLQRINPTADCNVNIPEGITTIGSHAFQNCDSLEGTINLPVRLKEIGELAFYDADKITELHFTDGEGGEGDRELTIVRNAFNHCDNLNSIHFPTDLTTLKADSSAYYNCKKLEEINIPGGLVDITTGMGFQGMTYLKKITVEKEIRSIAEDSLPKGNLEEIWLPGTLTAIANELFWDASKLQRINPTADCNVNIPEGITTIGEFAFRNCDSLEGTISLPVSLKEIKKHAFYDADKITGIHFADGSSELTIGMHAFNHCDSLNSIHFPSDLTDLAAEPSAYYNCPSLKEITIPGSLKEGAVTTAMGFDGMTYLTKITVEEGITSIAEGSLYRSRLEEIWLPGTLTAISNNLFKEASKLQRINPTDDRAVNLPEGIETIGASAFEGCINLTGDLVIPDRVISIGNRAFYGCTGFAGDLYLPDHLCTMGNHVFYECNGITTIHTSLTPVSITSTTFNNFSIPTVWYRGTDDTDNMTADGQSASWATFFNKVPAGSRIYIDDTVKHLTLQAFWGNYGDINFVGPNVVTLEKTGGKNIFAAAPAPLSDLEGTYYVTEEGALYALDPAAGTAALAYCPPGIKDLYIPLYITATEEMTSEADRRYARSYKVALVSRHAVMAAADLETVTAGNPQQITLSVYAFADCPTLRSVNGVTTQKEANALFGPGGTPAIKKAFVNTGLDEDGGTGEPSGPGKPMRSLTYTNPSVGKLTVNIRRAAGLPAYEDDAYRLLTGECVAFDLKAEAYGTGNLVAPFRIYFEAADLDFQGISTGSRTVDFVDTSSGKSYATKIETVYDRVSGCYCVSFSLPAGATWEYTEVTGSTAETVMYPALTRGGELCVWGEVLDFTEIDDGGEEEEDEEDEIFGGFSGEENYMMISWSTKRNLYELNLENNRENQASINTTTHKPRFPHWHGIGYTAASRFVFREDGENNTSRNGIGKDPVTKVRYRYTVTLPEGMTWADEEMFNRSTYPKPGAEIISVSGDRRVLTCEFEQSIPEDNYCYYGSMANNASLGPSSFELGYSYAEFSNRIIIGDDYDFYRDLDQKIEYKCQGTVYYKFSEPDEMQEVTVYERLLPTEAGTVELKRQYAFPDDTGNKRGRGLPMEISFVAENKGKDPAYVDLWTITDEVVNENGYLYLTPEQMADVILDESEYLEADKIEITGVTLYQGSDYESGVTHTGTDGSARVCENLLNTYTEPEPSANVKLTLTVQWPSDSGSEGDDVSGDGSGRRRPTGLTIKVNNGAETTIPFSLDQTELAGNIGAALKDAGYLVPTGLYKITWNATGAARNREVGPYTDTEGGSYWWTIGSYRATVKPDYVQGHHWIKSDSRGSFSLFPTNGWIPTAQAVFTLGTGSGSYKVTDTTRDTSYPSSRLSMNVRSVDSRTGNEVLVQDNQSQWICPGVVLSYQITYQNGNSIAFGDIPFMQSIDRNQCLLAPVDKNPDLEGAGYPRLSDSGYAGGQFRGRDYYMLMPGDTVQELEGVWLGGDDEAGDFYAESVSIAGSADSGEETETLIRWYEKYFGPYGEDTDTAVYRFYTYVLEPETAEERPRAVSRVYANNYKNNAYSTRLYGDYSGSYRGESIYKEMIANPELAGTAEEKTTGDQRLTYLGAGTTVTYRLSFDEYWISDYTLEEGEIYDLLPRTYGAFAWKLGDNVQVKYALKERIAQSGQTNAYEEYPGETGEGFARITRVEEQVNGMGEKVEQYKLSFGNFTIPYNRTLYIYVTLTFPNEQRVWEKFADAADTKIYNTFYYQNLKSSVEHMIARPSQVFLKTGMYGTDGDPYGYIYSNSDEVDRIVKYYVVLYNHGKSYLYLNPVHIKVPEGFTLKDPPKTYYGGRPDWNLTDVSVTDEDPPANISRKGIEDVKVTWPEEGEAALDIELSGGWTSYSYDQIVGKYFLRPGEYVAMEVRFTVEGYQDTPDEVYLPAAMPIDDSYHVGRITQVQGVDAHRSGYQNSNEGIPEFWESDEIAAEEGFTHPNPSDTGKWVASAVRLTREEAKPGVTKGAPVLMRTAGREERYDPQEGVAMEHPVKWESRLVNGGSNALTDYLVKDSVQWPYVFDGEVNLSSQIGALQDKSFTISRYTQEITLEDGERVEQVDRGRLKIGNQEVRIADSREEAFAEDSGCYATVFGGARVYFYKEDVFGDERPAETMEFDLTEDRTYGIGPASYVNGRVVENDRVLSYWTKFDMSMKNKASRTSYANRIVMRPRRQQPYTKAEVSEGIAIDADGDPVTDTEGAIDGIMALGYVSVSAGRSTAAWMKVKENKKAGEEDQGPEITEDIADVLTRENKILQGDVDNTVTYTLNILNHVANPNDTVQSEEDRKYSIRNMVIINTLPYVGDKMPFNSKVPRNSDFEILPDKNSFNIALYYYDADPGEEQETDIPENRLQEIPEDYYQILYSESRNVDSRDWWFNENSGAGWNTAIPTDLAAKGWKSAADFEDITKARSIRIEIKDPNTEYDSAEPSSYRSLMKAGRTIVVKYQARIQTEVNEEGVQSPTPGQCAWNSFGYRFDRFDGGAAMEASSIRTGVQIPSIPILYEKLIDYDLNPYPNPGEPVEFTFTIDRQEGVREDGTTRPAQQLRFSVTVGTGASENNRELREIKDKPEITWWREEGDDSFFWEEGASYTVKQVTAPPDLPLFSVRVNGQLTTGFVYDPLYEPVIVVTNQSKFWSSRLYKMDSDSKGWDPTDEQHRENIHFLPGALFGLYTADEAQELDLDGITEESGERFEWYKHYKSLLNKMAEITYGDDTDTAVKLYLKDFAVTDENGEIRWLNLEDDKYYVRELDPPIGFKLDETYRPITRRNEVLSVYDEPGIRFPITGGGGTLPFYITGGLLIAADAIYEGRRRRKKKDRNQNAGRTKDRARRPGLIRIGGVTLTLALAVKILARVIQIRREKRPARTEKRAQIRACRQTFRKRKREVLRLRRKAGRQM